MTSKFLYIFIYSFLLTSCANHIHTISSKKPREDTVFSKETEFSFEMIERNKAIERYKELRSHSKKTRRYKKRKSTKSKKQRSYKKYISKKIKKVVKPKFHNVNKEEQEQELLQRMSFFCMAHRKDRRFNEKKGGENCSFFTEGIMANCEVKYPIGTRELSSCVKLRLK